MRENHSQLIYPNQKDFRRYNRGSELGFPPTKAHLKPAGRKSLNYERGWIGRAEVRHYEQTAVEIWGTRVILIQDSGGGKIECRTSAKSVRRSIMPITNKSLTKHRVRVFRRPGNAAESIAVDHNYSIILSST